MAIHSVVNVYMYVCMYVRRYVCMYVCVCVYICVYIVCTPSPLSAGLVAGKEGVNFFQRRL